MRLEIKICGITTPEGLEAAADAGADAIGLVFAESVRRLDLARARELARLAPAGLGVIAVFRHPRAQEVHRVVQEVAVTAVQTDAEDYESIAGALGGAAFRPVYRDGPLLAQQVAVGGRLGLNRSMVLVEGPRSGSGVMPDWRRIAAAAGGLRVALAGGLTAANVADAIAAISPAGVDVSSGVESAPGVKDPARIRAFVSAARSAAAAALREGQA